MSAEWQGVCWELFFGQITNPCIHYRSRGYVSFMDLSQWRRKRLNSEMKRCGPVLLSMLHIYIYMIVSSLFLLHPTSLTGEYTLIKVTCWSWLSFPQFWPICSIALSQASWLLQAVVSVPFLPLNSKKKKRHLTMVGLAWSAPVCHKPNLTPKHPPGVFLFLLPPVAPSGEGVWRTKSSKWPCYKRLKWIPFVWVWEGRRKGKPPLWEPLWV